MFIQGGTFIPDSRVPEVRNYGDFRQPVIPATNTCMLRGTPCYSGFSYTFYGGKICSVDTKNSIGFIVQIFLG